MASNLMDTEVGGEQTQYESVNTFQKPHKKSGGQLGHPETTVDPAETEEAKQRKAERGERTAENIRYGQGISEQGMGGMTSGQFGEATEEGNGSRAGQSEDRDGVQQRKAQGYGDDQDMSRNVGA